MNRDKLNFVAPIEAVRDAYAIVDRVQDLDGARQVAAIAVAFSLYAESIGISPSELINRAHRIVADADTHYTREAKALRDYVKQEVV